MRLPYSIEPCSFKYGLMTDHTGRLVIVVLLFIVALSALRSGFWLGALAYFILMGVVGSPFVRDGKIDLYYDEGPTMGGCASEPLGMFAGVPIIAVGS